MDDVVLDLLVNSGIIADVKIFCLFYLTVTKAATGRPDKIFSLILGSEFYQVSQYLIDVKSLEFMNDFLISVWPHRLSANSKRV
jgi:hypothetical protein